MLGPLLAALMAAGQGPAAARPADPQACLAMANQSWDPAAAQPLFDCWLPTASREDLVKQAMSGSWPVRGLALRALTQASRAPNSPGGMSQLEALRAAPGSAPAFEWLVSQALFNSIVQVLSHEMSEHPAPNTISPETARQARDALWEVSEHNMTMALTYADRIAPIGGRDAATGRFGASADLASKDPRAYAARRRAWQLLAAAALALLVAALRAVHRWRGVMTALLAAIIMWAAWFSFQTDVRELPPLPLALLTASCLAFLSAGLAAGVISRFPLRRPIRVAAAAPAAAACAFIICAATRAAGLFPAAGEGWTLMLEPIRSAALAAPAALVIALTSGAGAAARQTARRS
jgi:hypothetical protein